MGVNPELNNLQKEVTRQRILETGFRLFAEKTIEKVKMTDVAEAGGISVATIYRYYPNKTALVLAISTWAWEKHLNEMVSKLEKREVTAAEEYEYFLDSFLDLYRINKALLRFNQFFNVYIENEKDVPAEAMQPYIAVADVLAARFEVMFRKAQEDHTVRTDIPPKEMLMVSLHLMLAAVTRYAVGLIYGGERDSDKELVLLKNMLLREFTQGGGAAETVSDGGVPRPTF